MIGLWQTRQRAYTPHPDFWVAALWRKLMGRKVLGTQQKDGDSPSRMIVPVVLEESRREMMDGLRSFTAVDTCAAVAIGDLQKEL